jgi:hypothetical protein
MPNVIDHPPAPIRACLLGRGSAQLSQADLERLFRGQELTPARKRWLAKCRRMVAMCGDRVVGMAAYRRAEGEVRVLEFGLDGDGICCPAHVAEALLEAIELGCLAAGGRRVVLTPRAIAAATVLKERRYATVSEGCAGAWFEKSLP